MLFSIYDYQNRFLTGKPDEESASIYTGTTKTEADYGYMRQPPGVVAEGADIGMPYFAEFRIANGEDATGDVTLTVLGAKPVMDGDNKYPTFNDDGTPIEPDNDDYHAVGTLIVAQDEAADPVPHRVAFSDSRHKWFKVEVGGASASAFLLRG
jgi:hypothetical protein